MRIAPGSMGCSPSLYLMKKRCANSGLIAVHRMIYDYPYGRRYLLSFYSARVLFTTMAGYCYFVIWFLAHMEKRKRNTPWPSGMQIMGSDPNKLNWCMHICGIHTQTGTRAPWEIYTRQNFVSLPDGASDIHAGRNAFNFTRAILALWMVFLFHYLPSCASNFYDSINSTRGDFIASVPLWGKNCVNLLFLPKKRWSSHNADLLAAPNAEFCAIDVQLW